MFDQRLQAITNRLSQMTPQQRQQFAKMHRDDPILIGLAKFVNDRDKALASSMHAAQLAQQPQQPPVVEQEIEGMAAPEGAGGGIAALPAQNLEGMADGGIVGYSKGGTVDIDKLLDAEGVKDPRERAFIKAIYQQETASGTRTKTSNRGARGPMQVMPGTFPEVAEKGWDIDNPEHNVRAGIRYARKGFQEAGGDPALAGAYYYGGPGGMQRTKAGENVKDPKNPDYPGTQDYGKAIAKTAAKFLTDMMPGGTAHAAVPPSAPATTYEQRVNLIPGHNGEPVPPQPRAAAESYQNPYRGTMDQLTDIYGKAKAVGSAALAIPYNIGATIGSAWPNIGDPKAAEENLSRVAWRPEGQGGELLDRFAEATGWLPPHIGARAPVRVPAAAAPAAKAADAATSKVASVRLANNPTPPAPNPRLSAAGQAKVAAGQKARAAESAAASQAALKADQAAASAAQAKHADAVAANTGIAAGNAQTAQAGARANGIAGIAATNQVASRAGTPMEVSVPSGGEEPQGIAAINTPAMSHDDLRRHEIRERNDAALPAMDYAKSEIVTAAKAAAPEHKGKGLSGEDWLMLGLNLMANKSPRFLTALGESGIGALKARQERGKQEAEERYRASLGRQADAMADYYGQGTKGVAAAMAAVDKEFDNWFNSVKDSPEFIVMPQAQRERMVEKQRRKIMQRTFDAYKLPLPAGVNPMSQFKVLGPEPA